LVPVPNLSALMLDHVVDGAQRGQLGWQAGARQAPGRSISNSPAGRERAPQ
jgi:hypothetical protein